MKTFRKPQHLAQFITIAALSWSGCSAVANETGHDANLRIEPDFREVNGRLIVVPKVVDIDADLNLLHDSPYRFAGTETATTTSPTDRKLAPEDLRRLYFNSESFLHRELLETGSLASSLQSVSPGRISQVSAELASPFLDQVLVEQPDWRRDPCNEHRVSFNREIESRIRTMFPSLDKNGTLSSWDIAERQRLADITRAYDEACLMTLDQAVTAELLTTKHLSRLVIITKDGMPLCGGLRLSRNRIITAKHCFFHPETGRPFEFTDSLRDSAQRRIEVHILDRPAKAFEVSSTVSTSNVGQYGIREDYLLLTIRDSPDLEDPTGTIADSHSEAQLLEPALLVGYYAFHSADWRFQLTQDQMRAWQEGIRLTRGSYCRVFDISRNRSCLAHGCQSMVLFSGGPLISTDPEIPTGETRLLGIHSRPGSESRTCGEFEQSAEWSLSAVGDQGGLAVSAVLLRGLEE